MSDFKAKVCKTLSDGAQQLVTAYDSAPGSTGPGANPPSIAAVLHKLVINHVRCLPGDSEPSVRVVDILNLVKELKD
jgi:hypothetical protein